MEDRLFVVGVDGSDVAQEALRWTERFAAMLGGEIVVVHAVGLLEERDQPGVAEVVEHDWCASLRRELAPYRIVVRDGHPVDVLTDVARETGADLVVVGSRGMGGRPALTLGSTSLRVLQVAPCPVLVIPSTEEAARHLTLQRLLVAVDGLQGSAAVIDYVCDLAVVCGAWLEIVHAVEDVEVFPLGPATAVSAEDEWEAPRHAAEALDPLRRRVDDRGVPVHVRVEFGSPEEVVTEVAAEIDADLVVLASRHVDDPDASLLEGVSRQVVRIAHRPVLVVPIRSKVSAA